MNVATASHSRLEGLLVAGDPIAAARAAGVRVGATIRLARAADRTGWLVDGDAEGPLDAHRAAHAEGRPSEAAVAYGAGRDPDAVAARIDGLARLARETGMLRAVAPVPGEGGAGRPGSWGVEDLTVIAVCRLAMPEGVAIRPHWRRLGPAACQVAVAFGASEWLVPEDDRTDAAALAAAVGASLETA
jgi:2-iminoacetate synthase ThiH